MRIFRLLCMAALSLVATQPAIADRVEDFYRGRTVDNSQSIPGVPKMSERQVEALDVVCKTVDACAADIPFEPGDMRFLPNNVIQHSRRVIR